MDVAERMGVSQAEVYALRRVVYACSIEKLEVTFAQRKVQRGVGIRVALDKKVGFSCTSSASEQSIKEAIEKALKIAMAREEDPRFKSFPSRGNYQKVLGNLDKEDEDISFQLTEYGEKVWKAITTETTGESWRPQTPDHKTGRNRILADNQGIEPDSRASQ